MIIHMLHFPLKKDKLLVRQKHAFLNVCIVVEVSL